MNQITTTGPATCGGIFERDSEVKAFALTSWANRIETGDGNLSARDAKRLGRPAKPIRPEAAAFVERLRNLAVAALAGA